jgi:hypothetical protein
MMMFLTSKTALLQASLLAVVFLFAACTTDEAPPKPLVVSYDHPIAPSGRTTTYLDGSLFPFMDNFNYGEYVEGDELDEEYGYYRKLGYHSYFEIDLNAADSNYISFVVLDSDVRAGDIFPLSDSAYRGMAGMNYEFNKTFTTSLRQHVISGAIQITKVDIPNKQISGIYSCTIQNVSDHAEHTLEGSFTDVFYIHGDHTAEVATAEVSGTNWQSEFQKDKFFSAFGNTAGQRAKKDHFAVIIHTDEGSQEDYESISFYLQNPIKPGTYDLEPGCAIYTKSSFDKTKNIYVVDAADTNQVLLPHAVTVTSFDIVSRRIAGTFDFTIEDNSSRSPIVVHNGKFLDLTFW